MKLAVDLPDELLAEIDRLATARQCSRDAIIQAAVAAHLAERRRRRRAQAFGLWGDQQTDGLEYQRKLRSEWDD